MSLKVGIVGAAGYAGAELIRLVLGHPEFELVAITSNADAGQPLSAVTSLCPHSSPQCPNTA